jgi:hypothetical protein
VARTVSSCGKARAEVDGERNDPAARDRLLTRLREAGNHGPQRVAIVRRFAVALQGHRRDREQRRGDGEDHHQFDQREAVFARAAHLYSIY